MTTPCCGCLFPPRGRPSIQQSLKVRSMSQNVSQITLYTSDGSVIRSSYDGVLALELMRYSEGVGKACIPPWPHSRYQAPPGHCAGADTSSGSADAPGVLRNARRPWVRACLGLPGAGQCIGMVTKSWFSLRMQNHARMLASASRS